MGLLRLLHLPPKKTLPILSAKVVETAAKLVDWCGFLQIATFSIQMFPLPYGLAVLEEHLPAGSGQASPSNQFKPPDLLVFVEWRLCLYFCCGAE